MVKITHEKWKCIGCGACAAVCADYWEMKDDGKSHLKNAEYKKTEEGELGELEVKEAGCNKEAEAGCPVKCIHVKEEEKKEEAKEEPAEKKEEASGGA